MIPSEQESEEALKLAITALNRDDRFWFGNQKIEEEFYELGLLTDGERCMVLDIALHEITPSDRKGPNPPGDVASHFPFTGRKLFAFKWLSKHFGMLMYLKFALIDDAGPVKLALYSLHEDRKEAE